MPKAGAGRKENRADGVSVRIHTPTIISIYVPTWGTTRRQRQLRWNTYFNPRPHVGDDSDAKSPDFAGLFQSTSPRRGRPSEFCGVHPIFDFNPRPHVGDDAAVKWHDTLKFISIHVPTWGRLGKAAQFLDFSNFNPRPHRGDDVLPNPVRQR